MAKICEYCGRELAAGEECTCPQSVLMRSLHQPKEPQEPAAYDQEPSRPALVPDDTQVSWGDGPSAPADPLFQQMGEAPAPAPRRASRLATAFRNIGPFFRAYCRAPGSTVKTACEHHDLPLAIIYLALFLLMGGLFSVTLFCRAAELLAGAMSGLGSMLQGFLGGFGGMHTSIAVPMARTFLLGMLFFAVCAVMLTLAVFAAGKASRTGTTLQQSFLLCGLNTLAPSLGLLLATAMLFFSLRMTVYSLLLTAVAWLVTTVLCAYQMAGSPASGRYWLTLVLCVVAAYILGGFLCGQIFETALAGISVNGSPLGALYSQYGGYYPY